MCFSIRITEDLQSRPQNSWACYPEARAGAGSDPAVPTAMLSPAALWLIGPFSLNTSQGSELLVGALGSAAPSPITFPALSSGPENQAVEKRVPRNNS